MSPSFCGGCAPPVEVGFWTGGGGEDEADRMGLGPTVVAERGRI